MQLVFTKPFGNFKQGDEIEVPDGATYDHNYLRPAVPTPPPTGDKAKDKK